MATIPAAVAAAEVLERIQLLQAGAAVPVAGVLAVLTLVLARSARKRVERTLGRARGRRTAWIGRALGLLAVALAASGTVALVTYVLLGRLAE